jgi:hypothetical protein
MALTSTPSAHVGRDGVVPAGVASVRRQLEDVVHAGVAQRAWGDNSRSVRGAVDRQHPSARTQFQYEAGGKPMEWPGQAGRPAPLASLS